jgi:hypothetical protein
LGLQLTGCTIQTLNTVIRCTTPAGGGVGGSMRMNILGQTIVITTANSLVYEPPVINDIQPRVIATNGSTIVTITGTNLVGWLSQLSSLPSNLICAL